MMKFSWEKKSILLLYQFVFLAVNKRNYGTKLLVACKNHYEEDIWLAKHIYVT